jgi:hypothetical protein
MTNYLLIGALLLGLLLPLQASAITISSLEVDITAGRTFAIWANTTINPGQQAIFTQNGDPSNGYNFDSSDPTNCVPGCVPQVKVTLGGSPQTFNDTGGILAGRGTETGPAPQITNEGSNWVLIGSVNIGAEHIDVFVGYADNAHTFPGIIPSPWQGDSGVAVFDGTGTTDSGNPCTSTPGLCFDAGAVRIVDSPLQFDLPRAVPAPSPLILLGISLVAMSLFGSRPSQG